MWRRILYSRVTLVLVIILAGFMANTVWHTYLRQQASLDDRQRVEAKLTTVENRATQLTATINALKTPYGVEREIRNKFNVVKEGEELIMIVGGEATGTPTTTPSVQRNLVEQFLDLFR